MRLRPLVLVVLLAVALSPACKDKERSAAPAVTGASILAPGVKPGSHEDWCEEHQVPESQCTRCHPELIPAFKASGDWDEEHHLPMSQCTECTPPHQPVRPPKSS
jgi:hypothetical protein